MVRMLLAALSEFKRFALRGAVIEMAVGFAIAQEFTTLVSSFVTNVLMPLISVAGRVDFSGLVVRVPTADGGEAAIRIGAFLDAVAALLIAAWAVFVLIKTVNVLKEKEAREPAEPAKASREAILLQEIRDLLAAKAG